MKRYLTVVEAADYLNTSQRFIRRLIAERRIPFHHVGRHVRIATSDLDAFILAGRVDAITVTSARGHLRGAAWMARGNKDGHRRFGLIRTLPSGRFQASYLGPDGLRRLAPTTYESKRDAERFLVRVESAMMSDEWTDPLRARVPPGTTPSGGSPSVPDCAPAPCSSTAGCGRSTSARISERSSSDS